MSKDAYNWLANAFMLLAVASAMFFDSGRLPHIVVGAVGVLSGVAAISLYFWNQSEGKKREKASLPPKATPEFVVPASIANGKLQNSNLPINDIAGIGVNEIAGVFHIALNAYFGLDCDDDLQAIQSYGREVAKRFPNVYPAHQAKTLLWHIVRDSNMGLMRPELELSVNEVAACAVEIMRMAAIEEMEVWDYSLNSRGLHVSLKKTRAVLQPTPQAAFSFDLISALPS